MIAIITIAMVLTCFPLLAGAEGSKNNNKNNSTKYNVVFVIDDSGSMQSTDQSKFRYNAINLFLGLMADKGNYAGSILFSNDVVYSQELKAVNGSQDKNAIQEGITSHGKAKGDTDVGMAIDKAIEMLDKGRDKNLPSVIVLLTDGNTDLDNNPSVLSSAEKDSQKKKADAIEKARDASRGYRVFSICLNEDGSADIAETEQIAKATGGKSQEVKEAEDLNDVFKMFYSLIYGSNEFAIWNGVIPDSRKLICEFDVPNSGVEEANVLINGKIKKVTIQDPSDKAIDDKQVQTTQSRNIKLKKIYNPVAGKWHVVVEGTPRTRVKINLLYNYTFKVEDTTKLKDSYIINDELAISANITDEGRGHIDKKDLSEFECMAHLIDADNKEIDTVKLTAGDSGFSGKYKIPSKQSFSYYVSAKYKFDDKYGTIEKSTEPKQVVVDNSPPTSNGDVKETVRIWPFTDGATYKLDLTTLATDKEDKELTYSVIDSSFISKDEKGKDGDYEIKGNTLVQDNYSLWRGSYVIRCKDSGGLYCDVKVTVTALNIGIIALILMGLAALIVALIFLIGLRIALTKPSAGCISVRQSTSNNSEQVNYWRGRCKLTRFELPPSHLDYSKCYFQAEGKPYTTLVTDKHVYAGGKETKEVRIQNSFAETQISLDKELRNIIFVRFSSSLPNAGNYRRKRVGLLDSIIGGISGLFSRRRRNRSRSNGYAPRAKKPRNNITKKEA